MSNLSKRNQEELTKRYLALGISSAGLASMIFGSTFFGIILLGVGGWLGWRWLQYRIKNSMRF